MPLSVAFCIVISLVVKYSSLACILPSDLARSRCSHAIACPWAVRSCCFSSVALRSAPGEPHHVSSHVTSIRESPNTCSAPWRSSRRTPSMNAGQRHRRLERNDVLGKATFRYRRRKFHVLGANFLLTRVDQLSLAAWGPEQHCKSSRRRTT